MAKSMKFKSSESNKGATKDRQTPLGNPADYPIGSPESRAAARAMLDAMKPAPLSERDMDCLTLCRSEHLLFFSMNPDGDALRGTEAYKHGREVWARLHPGEPFYDGPEEVKARESTGSLGYRLLELTAIVTGREIQPGDKVSFKDFAEITRVLSVARVMHFVGAWKRQIPSLPCPFKVEGELVFWRSFHPAKGESWHSGGILDTDRQWEHVEESAGQKHQYDYSNPGQEWKPTIEAVVIAEGNQLRPLNP
jgi:hypothetical protein